MIPALGTTARIWLIFGLANLVLNAGNGVLGLSLKCADRFVTPTLLRHDKNTIRNVQLQFKPVV